MSGPSPFHILAALAMLAVLPVYFTPTIVAAVRESQRLTPILVGNVLTAWLVIPWIALLVWAIRSPARQHQPSVDAAGSP